MAILVQQFGTSSLADGEGILRAAQRAVLAYREGWQTAVVVSPCQEMICQLKRQLNQMGIPFAGQEAKQIWEGAGQICAAQFAMVVQSLGIPAVSLPGWQDGMQLPPDPAALAETIDWPCIQREMEQGNLVILPAPPGSFPSREDALGEPREDAGAAVAAAVVLRADRCQLYTQTGGIYAADPHWIPETERLEQVSYEDLLLLERAGEQILPRWAVSLAQQEKIRLEVCSVEQEKPGTLVTDVRTSIPLIIREKPCAMGMLRGIPQTPGMIFRVFSLLGAKGIRVDAVRQEMEPDRRMTLYFALEKSGLDRVKEMFSSFPEEWETVSFTWVPDLSQITILGDLGETAISRKVASLGVPIHSCAYGKRRAVVLVEGKDSPYIVKKLYDAFAQERGKQTIPG